MTRCFNQKEELLENLKQVEILFNESDIKLHNVVKEKISELRGITEESEIWMSEFIQDYHSNQKIMDVIRIIEKQLARLGLNCFGVPAGAGCGECGMKAMPVAMLTSRT